MAAAGIAATVQVFRRVSADRWVEHTREVQTLADKLLTNPIDAETGVRGYVLTGKEAFLEPYMASIQVVFTNIASLKAMTAGNSPQQKFLESIQRRVHLRILELEKIASFVKRGEQSKAVEAVRSEYGESVMQAVRGQIAKFGEEEERLPKMRERKSGIFWTATAPRRGCNAMCACRRRVRSAAVEAPQFVLSRPGGMARQNLVREFAGHFGEMIERRFETACSRRRRSQFDNHV